MTTLLAFLDEGPFHASRRGLRLLTGRTSAFWPPILPGILRSGSRPLPGLNEALQDGKSTGSWHGQMPGGEMRADQQFDAPGQEDYPSGDMHELAQEGGDVL
jgi:hypothetical protein